MKHQIIVLLISSISFFSCQNFENKSNRKLAEDYSKNEMILDKTLQKAILIDKYIDPTIRVNEKNVPINSKQFIDLHG